MKFTPLMDDLVREYGVVVASVYGRIWRYQQGDSGKCTASVRAIAYQLGLGHSTVHRAIQLLISEGLVEDLTPEHDRKRHVYICPTEGQFAKSVPQRDNLSHSGTELSRSDPLKIQEETLKETTTVGVVFSKFENEIQLLTHRSVTIVEKWLDEYPEAWILDAIDIAVEQNHRSPSYVAGILRNWRRDGKDSGKRKKQDPALPAEVLT